MTWITWVIATLCAAAVGSRLGRLTVRPPSLARTAVAIAAVSVAAAAAVRTPTVAVVISAIADEPENGTTPMLVFVGCWVVVAAATAMIASAAWPQIGRRALYAATVLIPLLGVGVLVAMTLTGEMFYGAAYIMLACLFAL